MNTKTITLFLCFIGISKVFGQSKIMTIPEAIKEGTSIQYLDSLYKSAVHSNNDLAVFKTPEEQQKLQKAYISFFQNFGEFLKKNNFIWDKTTRCFNRIYMNSDGTVDYFLFNFQKDQLTATKEKEFTRLLSLFTKENKFPISANEKFAQCSPIVYGN